MALEKSVQLTGKAKTDGITIPLARLAEQTKRTREETERLGNSGAKAFGKLQQQADAAAKKQAAAAQRAENDIRRQIAARSQFMAQEAKASEQRARQAAIEAQKRGQQFKQNADDQIAFAGRFAAGVGIAAFAVDKLSQRQLQNTNITKNLKISIDGARESTQGFISDMELARSAALATSFGVVKTDEDFARLAATAQKLGARLGIDTATAMGDLTLAISRQSPKILDNLGIQLKLTEATEIHARILGKSTKAMTEAEKADSFRVAALYKAEQATKGVNVATEGGAANVQRAKVALVNATDATLGYAFAFTDAATPAIKDFFHASTGGIFKVKSDFDDLYEAEKRAREGMVPIADIVKKVAVETGNAKGPVTSLMRAIDNLGDKFVEMKSKSALDGLTRSLEIVNEKAQQLSSQAVFEFQNSENAKAALHDLMIEEKLHRSIGASEADLFDIQQRKYAVLKEEAALRFDMFEVMRLIREEEASLFDFGGPKRSGGGRKGPSRAELIRGQLGREAGFRAVNRDAFTARTTFGSGLAQGRAVQSMQSAGEAFGTGDGGRMSADNLARIEAEEQAKAEIQLSSRMRAIEMQREAGVEPLQLIAAEEQARVAFLEGELARSEDAIEQMRLRDSIEAEHHAARLKRMAIEQEKQKAHQALILGYTHALQEAMIGTGAAALQAALMGEGGVRAAVHSFAKGKSIEMVILAASETARGIAALASPFTAALAPGHFAAAGQAAAAGALIGVVAGVTMGGGGGGGSSGLRPDATSSRGGMGGSGGINMDRSAAVSPGGPIISRGASGIVQSQAGSATPQGNTTVVNFHAGAFQALGYGSKDDVMMQVKQGLASLDRRIGKE